MVVGYCVKALEPAQQMLYSNEITRGLRAPITDLSNQSLNQKRYFSNYVTV